MHAAPFQAPAFSPDGSHLLFAGITDEGDSALMTLDRNNNRQQVIDGYEGSVAFQWSPSGEYIAFGTWDNKVYLFDKDANDPLWSYQAEDIVRSVAISADGE